MSVFDLNAFRMEERNFSANKLEVKSKNLPKHKIGDKFLKGPIPWDWLTCAGKLGGKTIHVALVIWHIAMIKGKNPVPVSMKRCQEMGINRHSVYRALQRLEGAGLISIERCKGRNPVATIEEILR